MDIKIVNKLLDDLYMELLHLIEQHTQCRLNIERLTKSGQLLLAKTRYVQGINTVSIDRVPTEHSEKAFKALCRVVSSEREDDCLAGSVIEIQNLPLDKTQGYVEPLNWFHVLAPGSLRNAAVHFKRCLPLVAEAANIQREMLAVIESIEQLRRSKERLQEAISPVKC